MVFYGIIGLNSAVFGMWFLAAEKYVGSWINFSFLLLGSQISETKPGSCCSYVDGTKFHEQLAES
jgi:hypothetical protein